MASYHPDFCYADGSLVLLVQETTSFQVHKDILCQHSSVLKAMLSHPPPTSTAESDGALESSEVNKELPIIRLPQDDASGFASVLKAMYDCRFFDQYLPTVFSQGEEPYLLLLSKMIPIARKYNFASVFDGCVDGLKRLAPTTLSGTQDRLAALRMGTDPDTLKRATHTMITTLNLAASFDLALLYPSLLCQIISFYTPDEIYAMPKLSWKDKTLCVIGIAKLRSEQLLCVVHLCSECIRRSAIHSLRGGEVWLLCARSSSSAFFKKKGIAILERQTFSDAEASVISSSCHDRYMTEYENN